MYKETQTLRVDEKLIQIIFIKFISASKHNKSGTFIYFFANSSVGIESQFYLYITNLRKILTISFNDVLGDQIFLLITQEGPESINIFTRRF